MISDRSKINLSEINYRYLILSIIAFLIVGATVPFISGQYASASIFAFLLFALCLIILQPLRTREDTQTLFKVVVISLLIRLVLTVITDSFFSERLGSDAELYAGHGWLIAESWRQGHLVSYESVAPYVVGAPGYVYLNAIVYYFGGFNPLLVQLINATLGALIAIPVYFLTRLLLGQKVALTASILVAFFPSMIFWSTQNMKDIVLLFLTVSAMYLVVDLGRKNFSGAIIGQGLLLIGILVALYSLRSLAATLILFWIIVQIVLQSIKDRTSSRFSIAIFMLAMLLLLVLSIAPIRSLTENAFNTASNLQEVDQVRLAQIRGGAAFGGNFSINSIEDYIRFVLAMGTAYLLRPFPWEANKSIFQLMTIPESFIWYGLFCIAIIGILILIKRDTLKYLLLWGYPLSVVLLSSPHYGNLGIVYRHRLQILPFFFILASVAIVYFFRKADVFAAGDQ